MSATLDPFNAEGTCWKCGSSDVNNQWHPKRDWVSIHDDSPEEEHIARHCRNCHYEWYEAPLDAGEAKHETKTSE